MSTEIVGAGAIEALIVAAVTSDVTQILFPIANQHTRSNGSIIAGIKHIGIVTY